MHTLSSVTTCSIEKIWKYRFELALLILNSVVCILLCVLGGNPEPEPDLALLNWYSSWKLWCDCCWHIHLPAELVLPALITWSATLFYSNLTQHHNSFILKINTFCEPISQMMEIKWPIQIPGSVGDTGCGLGDQGFEGWVLVRQEFSSRCQPDWFWGPSSLPSSGYYALFPQG
jgi:hypothetical protein